MHAEIAALARKHGLPDEVAADLEALWAGRSALATLVEGYEPVTLEAPPDAGGAETVDLSDDPPVASPPVERVGGRYEDLGPIGVGGMGEVRRVRDVALNRTLAMKVIHPRLLGRAAAVARFLDEAQATAQLQHPGILPVHDIGTLPDGRVWFAMKEVRGRTLTEVVAEVHAASGERWAPGASGWTFRRLVSALLSVCQAVAYAHERGVVHRDLKPENVMIGSHGEVVVLDWGLAKVVGRPEPTWDGDDLGEGTVVTRREGSPATRLGTVAGTPAYMAPEQARGQIDRLDARTDVYALGAMLYEILGGRPPYEGTAQAVLGQVLAGPPPPVGRSAPALSFGVTLDDLSPSSGGPPLPAELVAACERAMAREPDARFPSARALGVEIEAWLDGARRRAQALEVVEAALASESEAEALAARAAALRAESDALLEGVAPWEPEIRKRPGWTRAAEADAAEREARLRQLAVGERLSAALQISPGLPEAHAAIAERQRARHAAAELARDRRDEAEARALLEAHAAALPEGHAVRREATRWLAGDGALTLVTDPPGAEVSLYRYVERDRRLVEVFERSLGPTPLREVPLAMGSYVCVLRQPGRDDVRYPIEVARRAHWDGVPPDAREPQPVWLPPKGSIGPGEVYVPAGWFRAGGDPQAPGALPARRLWCDALVAHEFPVSNLAYLAFLDDLVARGREAEALRHAPRERAGVEGEQGALIYGFDGARFSLVPDADGHTWLGDWPVLHVDWHGARAYLAWLAERSGRPWRLPLELEWEKVARGVDGRAFPWGEHLDPSWCCMTDSHAGARLPARVGDFPVDTSPYGARGLAGNARDWCLDRFDRPTVPVADRVPAAPSDADEQAIRTVRGGTWISAAPLARCAARDRGGPRVRRADFGFRGVYGVGGP